MRKHSIIQEIKQQLEGRFGGSKKASVAGNIHMSIRAQGYVRGLVVCIAGVFFWRRGENTGSHSVRL